MADLEAVLAASGAGSYALMGLYTFRASLQIRRKAWMDKKIRERKAWEAGRPKDDRRVSKGPEDLLATVRAEWSRKGYDEATEEAFYSALLWPLYWVVRYAHHKPEPSREERALMDQASHERLRELERQAGLTPLDELEG